jgi:hypothetical protein
LTVKIFANKFFQGGNLCKLQRFYARFILFKIIYATGKKAAKYFLQNLKKFDDSVPKLNYTILPIAVN